MTSQINPNQKILADRILKLLALASSTKFAAEAQSARTIADQLMQKHNIILGPGKLPQDAIEQRDYTPFAKGMRWELMIACALANLCSCTVFWDDDLTSYSLVGSIGNLDILDYMLREISRQRIYAWNTHKRLEQHDTFSKFCYGFAQALDDKVQIIVPINQEYKRLVAWYEENILHRGINIKEVSMGPASSEAGLAAGKSTSLHRGAVGSQKPQKMIGHTK